MAKSKSEEQKIKCRTYMSRIEAAEKWRDNAYKDKWERYYKRWRNVVNQITDPKTGKVDTSRSNISVPYIYTMLETVLPRLVETLFAGRPYVTVKGRTRDWADNAAKMETLLDYQMNEVTDIQNVFHIGLKIMALYGTTVAYTGWKYEEREVIKKELRPIQDVAEDGTVTPLIDEMTEQPIMDYQPVRSTEVEYDDPEPKFMDLGLFYVDPNAEDIDDARYCGHVAYMSKNQLKQMEDQGFIDKVRWKDVEQGRKQNNARNDRMGAVGIPSVDAQDGKDDDLYECHYYYEDDKCVFIINRSYLARDSENPFWHKRKPYDKDVYSKVPGEFYGIGIVEMIEDQADELNTERNMRIDYRAHNLRRMFKVRKGANINPAQMVWRQNGRIEVEDMNDIDVFTAPSITGDTFNQEEIVKQDMRDTVGAHDVVMGASGSGETATTTMSKDNNASMRFKLVISSIEKRLLVGISRKMIQLNQQFVDNIRTLPMFENNAEDWVDISPEEIQGEFHLIAAGSSVEPMANKEAFKQRMVELFSIVGNEPMMQQFPDKRRNLLKKVFEAFDITDTEELLPSDEELSGAMQQQAISQFIGSLPPELQQILSQFMGSPPQPQQAPSGGDGSNTAMQAERGLSLVPGGG